MKNDNSTIVFSGHWQDFQFVVNCRRLREIAKRFTRTPRRASARRMKFGGGAAALPSTAHPNGTKKETASKTQSLLVYRIYIILYYIAPKTLSIVRLELCPTCHAYLPVNLIFGNRHHLHFCFVRINHHLQLAYNRKYQRNQDFP